MTPALWTDEQIDVAVRVALVYAGKAIWCEHLWAVGKLMFEDWEKTLDESEWEPDDPDPYYGDWMGLDIVEFRYGGWLKEERAKELLHQLRDILEGTGL